MPEVWAVGIPGIEKYANRVKVIKSRLIVPYQLRRVVVKGVPIPVFRFDFEAQGHLVVPLSGQAGVTIFDPKDGGPAIFVDATAYNQNPVAAEWILEHEKMHVRLWLETGEWLVSRSLDESVKGKRPSTREFWGEVYLEVLCTRSFPARLFKQSGWSPHMEIIRAIRQYLVGPNADEKAKRLVRFLRTGGKHA